MTDKPIIVDNIDVSKCEFLIITNDKHLCRCIKSDLFGGIEFVENARKGNCEDNPNCYYKQLQQEKQSSQESRDTSIEEFNRAEELNTLLKHKQQECEELKRYKSLFEKARDLWNEASKTNYKLLDEIEDLKDSLKRTICQSECYRYKEAEKLKQTLTEIKEISENVIKNVSDRCIETTPMYYIHKQILQKISECEGNDEN